MLHRTSTALIVLMLASLASAQPATADTREDRHDYEAGISLSDITIRGHDGWLGRVVSVDEEDVVVTRVDHPGSRYHYPREAVPSDTMYVIRRVQMDDDDPDAWMAQAEFAKRHGLLARRVEALRAARRLVDDPDRRAELERSIAAARTKVAEQRIERAKTLADAGDLQEARHVLDAMLEEYGSLAIASEARSMQEKLRGRESAKQAERDAAAKRRSAGEDGESEKNELVAEVEEKLGEGDEALQDGLAKLGDHVESERAFQEALDSFTDARELLADEAGQIEGHERLVTRVEAKQARAHVELGHVYLARGDDQSAYAHAGDAARLDPNAPGVASLRRAIATRDGDT